MTASGKSYRTCKTLDPMLTMEYIAAVREAYTGPDADWSRPCYSPLFADLRRSAPDAGTGRHKRNSEVRQ